MAKRGRPSTYSNKLADTICNYVSQGSSIRQIEKMDGMPTMTTIFKWLQDKPYFTEQYTRAKEEAAELFANEIIEIADNEEDTNRARVRIDARKWVASKLKPKMYGEKLQTENKTEHSGGVELKITHFSEGENDNNRQQS